MPVAKKSSKIGSLRFEPVNAIVADLQRLVDNGTKQLDLAKRLGISPGHLSELLSGKKQPGPTVLVKLGYLPTPYYQRSQA